MTNKNKPAVKARDHVYFIILSNLRAKHPEYTDAKLHAVATALRTKAAATARG